MNYGSHRLLSENIVSVKRGVADAQVVVVDNFTTASERLQVEALAVEHGLRTVLLDTNVGFGAGMNAGVGRARELGARVFLLLNPDATIDAPGVERLREHIKGNPWALVAPRILRPDGRVWFSGADLYLADGQMRAARRRGSTPVDQVEPWLTGACLMVHDGLWSDLGGFSEDYFLYWEDVDLSRRARMLGAQLVLDVGVTAVHDQGGTQRDQQGGSRAKSSTYYYFNIRNRLIYASQHLDDDGLRRWRRSAVPVAVQVLLQGGRRQFIHPIAPLAAAYRGLRDGRKIAGAALAARRAGQLLPPKGAPENA